MKMTNKHKKQRGWRGKIQHKGAKMNTKWLVELSRDRSYTGQGGADQAKYTFQMWNKQCHNNAGTDKKRARQEIYSLLECGHFPYAVYVKRGNAYKMLKFSYKYEQSDVFVSLIQRERNENE